MSTVSYGSITIVDITDIGEFSVTPSCNQPLNVLYDPDAGSYTPTWSSSNPLQVTPIMYYGGTQVDYSDGATVTWKRKVNSDAEADLISGETVTENVLIVSQNKLTTTTGPILTYICRASYVEPQSGVTLAAEGQISFTLVKNASTVKSVSISGDNIIKLDGDTHQPATGYEYVTLTATLENATMSRWQYKNSSGVWTNYPVTSGKNTSNTSTTLKVYYDESNVFVNDICYLRVAATITSGGTTSTIYDYYQVVLLKDGASGTSTLAMVLSNEDQMIPCDSSYTPTSLTGGSTTATVYEGGTPRTDWTYSVSSVTSGVTGTWDSGTRTWTLTAWPSTPYVASVVIQATDGETTLSKTFSLVKIATGADGTSPTVYTLEVDTLAANKDISNVFTPSTVTFSAYSTTGSTSKTAYSGRFRIYKNGSSTASTTTSTDATSYTYTFASSDEMIVCELLPSGGTGNVLDRQTVVVTSDGATGAQGNPGAAGASAVNVILGNYSDTIMCDSTGKVKSTVDLTIPFDGYVGTSRAACTLAGYAVNNVPVTGMKVKTHTDGTASASGSLVITVSAGSDLGGDDSGTLSLVFTCSGASVTHIFTWSKIIEGEDGNNAVFFQIYAPNGNVISNSTNSVTLQAQVTDGTTDVTSSATYAWYQWNGSSYDTTAIGTSSTITVTPAMVSSYTSFKCVATYASKSYTAYYSVIDKSDPIQVSVMSSIGEQIKNRVGSGAIYVRVTRNGTELDPIYGTGYFGTTAPTGVSSGEYWYYVDTSSRSIVLKKYNGSQWVNSSDTHENYYTWTFRDADGNIVTSYTVGSNTYNYPTSGKVIYIDGNMVDDKIIADVEVTI